MEGEGTSNQTDLQARDIVLVDQMVSPILGLVAQITGALTTKRYNYATVYVDQATRLGYVHLQKGAMAEETLEGKKAFEAYARSHGVSIKTYHADNGIFCDKLGTLLATVQVDRACTLTMHVVDCRNTPLVS
jgi:hypothetical protein